MKQFISVNDVPDIESLVQLALAIKANPADYREVGKGKSLAMLFFNSSLRTRLSTDLAAAKLGMDRAILNVSTDSWGLDFTDGSIMNADKAEHVKEAAGVIGGYADILAIRAFPSLTDREADYSEEIISAFNKYAATPLLSMESATLHPLQSLTDLVTIRELFPQKKKLKVALRWAPHPRKLPQAVANSFAQWMNKAEGIDLSIVHPKGFELHPDFSDQAHISHDPVEGLADADIVYVKNWSAYEPYGQTAPDLSNWIVDNNALIKTNNAKVMHCLPVRRNVVIADEVMDGTHSAIQQQANNRLWSAMAVLHELIKEAS